METRDCTPLAAAFSRVAVSACGSMSKQCAVARAQLGRRDGQHAGTAAKINDALTVNNMTVQPFQAQRRGGMGARSERQSRVHPHDDRARFGHFLVMRADPQSLPKAHRMEIAQPLALPNTILDALGLHRCRRNLQSRR